MGVTMVGMSAYVPLENMLEPLVQNFMRGLLSWRAVVFNVMFQPGAIKGTVAAFTTYPLADPCYFFPFHLNIFEAFELLIVQLVTQRAFVPPYSWNPFASVEASLEKQVIEASHITTGSY